MQGTSNTPLVSVIMNCYNGEKYLQKAIDSVYSQTYTNWEIIFWDNASTDDSAKIAKSYNSKVKYFYVANNTSLGRARISAIDKANGEYLAFLDCDDMWGVDKLLSQVQVLQREKDVGLVYSRCSIISGNDRLLGIFPENDELHSGNVFGKLVKENFIPFVSVLIPLDKYKIVGGFPSHYKNSTDYDLFLKISHIYRVSAIDEVLCKYREHNGNLSHSQYVIAAKESIESVESFLPDEYARNGLKYQYAQLVVAYLKDGKFIKALILSIKHKVLRILIIRILQKCC